MSDEKILKEYFVRYLLDIRKVSDSSARHYLEALRFITKRLNELSVINGSIYDIYDYDELKNLKEVLNNDSYYLDTNRRGNQMYSAGFNNYLRFASGETFSSMNQEIEILDSVRAVSEPIEHIERRQRRSAIIKIQTIKYAHYKCEVDSNHRTFISGLNNMPYMEGHHLIPLKNQNYFNVGLDVYANVLCLCPICHRQLHYGLKDDKSVLIDAIFDMRINRLKRGGIDISKSDAKDIIIG